MTYTREEIPGHIDDTPPLSAPAHTALTSRDVEILDLHAFKADIFTCRKMLTLDQVSKHRFVVFESFATPHKRTTKPGSRGYPNRPIPLDSSPNNKALLIAVFYRGFPDPEKVSTY